MLIQIYTSSGLTRNTPQDEDTEHMYDLCAYIPNIELTKGGHFGVSAATGGLAGKWPVNVRKGDLG